MDEISVSKIRNTAEYLPQIDTNEADADFICAVSENGEAVYAILHRKETVGLALTEEGPNAFLYVYIFPPFRRRGFGKAAVSLLEQELALHNSVMHDGTIHNGASDDDAIQDGDMQDGDSHGGAIKESDTQDSDTQESVIQDSAPHGRMDISTCYRSDDRIACSFAVRCGYEKEFASDHMVCSGPRFAPAEIPVRQYRDEDYPAAQSLSAEAFHRMRLGTGCFPDSAPEPPDAEERKYWAETAEERFVYLDGDEIIGYAHIQGNEIGSVSVKPGRQGNGVGKAFLKYLVHRLTDAGYTSISLYCVVGNDRARRLYGALGFVPVYRNVYAKKKVQ